LVVGIILLIILYHLAKGEEKTKQESPEDIKRRRISSLQNERSILSSHKQKIDVLEKKIDSKSDQYWRKLIRILTSLFLLANVILYLLFPDLNNLLVVWTVITGLINVAWLLFFVKLFSLKKFLFINLREFSYKSIAGHRDAEYFASKYETIDDRIAQIDFELDQLTS
jgi:hypothetical protein